MIIIYKLKTVDMSTFGLVKILEDDFKTAFYVFYSDIMEGEKWNQIGLLDIFYCQKASTLGKR